MSIRLATCITAFLALMAGSTTRAFLSHTTTTTKHHHSHHGHHQSSPFQSPSKPTVATLIRESKNDLFDSPGWESIRNELDQVPIFAVSNKEGQPLKSQIELNTNKKKDDDDDVVNNSSSSSYDVPLFYTHVDDALVELENARKIKPLPGMDINPYPLGGLFEMWSKNEAVIVPTKKSIMKAGAPPSANTIGQDVPLFACMEIAQVNEEGTPVLPLFLEFEDVNDAVTEAVSVDGGKVEDFEIVCLSLAEAVNLLSKSKEEGVKNNNAFELIPPSSSLKHIRDYLSG